ncbi:50S ribosomal protein P1 [archaeon]|nr:50S ribosomal protein P1 [archaeon]|tara:strand:+ start:2150 stop:2455 length:306 start_codon:yes stop_codon:yes gene_type:complete
MEYIYASLILNKIGKEITEENVKKVVEAAGASVDDNKVKMVVAALKDVNIAEVIKNAAVPVASASESGSDEKKEEKKEEKNEEEEKKKEEQASAGLGSLFG